MTHDLPRCDRFQDALPPDDEGQCPCDADLSGSNGPFDCSACNVAICEECALAGECRNDACGRVYCEKCAAKFLPAVAAGLCVTCGSPWRHQHATYQRLVDAIVEPLRRAR